MKIHIRSGKLTLMRFDDFDGQPLPRMIEGVKIKLRQQDCDYFGYGEEYKPPFLRVLHGAGAPGPRVGDSCGGYTRRVGRKPVGRS